MAVQVVLLPAVVLAGILTGGSRDGPLAALALPLGLVPLVAGAVLVGRGLVDLGRNLTPVPHPRDDAELVETGVYALVRHPIYGGLILAAFGWATVVTSLPALALSAVLAVFFDLKSRREEAWLAERYERYGTYRKRTRRFVPWLY